MSTVSRIICAFGAIAMLVMALRLTPVLWQVGWIEAVVVTVCIARMAVSMFEYAATGRVA